MDRDQIPLNFRRGKIALLGVFLLFAIPIVLIAFQQGRAAIHLIASLFSIAILLGYLYWRLHTGTKEAWSIPSSPSNRESGALMKKLAGKASHILTVFFLIIFAPILFVAIANAF